MMVEQIALGDLVAECLERKRGRAREKRIALDADLEGFNVVCRADRMLLRTALSNMIEAVVAYSRPGSSVTVSYAKDDTRERVCVSSDYGTIPFEELRTIRDFFCRPTMPEASEIEELGAPLVCFSLVKDIADLHGGKVGVRSSEEEGVSLTLYLPRRERGVA